MIKYWRGKHVILRKEDVIADYMERIRSRPRDKVKISLFYANLVHCYCRRSLLLILSGNPMSRRPRRSDRLNRSRRNRKRDRRQDRILARL